MKKIQAALLGAWIGCMLAFPRDAMAAALDGMVLFGRQVLPALFPMLTILLLITSRLPRCVPVCAMLSLLSGSPAGARLCAALPLPSAQKHRLAALSGTMSPMFLLSALPSIMGIHQGWHILVCHLAGAGLTALFCRPPDQAAQYEPSPPPAPLSLQDAIRDALKSMGVVMGCITLSTVLAALLRRALPFVPPDAYAILHPLIEVTGGLKTLADSALPGKDLLALLFVCLGGLSIQMQNAAFWQKGGVGALQLLLFRFVHALISGMLYVVLFRSMIR